MRGAEDERFINLRGAWNFRDIGGYRSRRGKRVEWRRVFRSDQLHELTDADRTAIARLGIKSVMDLRHASEIKEAEDRLPAGVRRFTFPIGEGITGGCFLDHAVRGEVAQVTMEEVSESYVDLLEKYAFRIEQIFDVLADAYVYPMIIHCRSGRDRTGLVIGLLLSELGVGREDILDDFELSGLCWAARLKKSVVKRLGSTVDFEKICPAFQPPREALANAFTCLAARYGSSSGYLRHRVGLPPAALARIQKVLLA